MDFIGATVSEAKLVFDSQFISLKEQDSARTILHYMEVDTSCIVDYYLNPGYESIAIGMDMRTFRAKIKGAQKKNTILTLSNNMDNPLEFYSKFKVPNKSNVPMTIIPTLRLKEGPEIEVPDYGTMEPSLVVHASDLSGTFSHIANSKCRYAEVMCFPRGILIKGIVNGKVDAIQTLGKCVNPYEVGHERAAEINGELVTQYIISNTNLKPFSKVNNIAPASATLRLYYADGYPLQIVFPVGAFGVHRVFLVSIDPTTMKPVA